jgi:hypothetical protein
MPLANGIGLTYEGCHDNWELTTDKLAKDFDHHWYVVEMRHEKEDDMKGKTT